MGRYEESFRGYFYPRSPCGERHGWFKIVYRGSFYFYPRSPCGERRAPTVRIDKDHYISIHALLAESDSWISSIKKRTPAFLSTLSLRRATKPALYQLYDTYAFLSTLSLRRATYSNKKKINPASHFYPRSPCGERPYLNGQPHGICHFYPRSPCGERLGGDVRQVNTVSISIHALLAESDARNTSIAGRITLFLSTLSLRRATTPEPPSMIREPNFYPRSPCGERLDERCKLSWNNRISIHALLAESDGKPKALKSRLCVFLSTLSLRRATK